ncbi:hypothetical protein [Massiliimalia timonensis]|uniref:hypothetical protein n=1 Tax=Massiliimalia timonensis TaxID=1987501 RepID=UPI000B8AD4F2|nr:hypothetical protein [Massiliimalia timonensis]
MNAQEKMSMLKCIALAQLKDGDEKSLQRSKIIAGLIEEDCLGAIVTPEEVSQACRLSEYELMYFKENRFVVLPNEQKELIQWMQELTSIEIISETVKEQIRKAIEILINEWK